jgi:hypothetical protein
MLRTAQFYGIFLRKYFHSVKFDQNLELNIARWQYLEACNQSNNASYISLPYSGVTIIVVTFIRREIYLHHIAFRYINRQVSIQEVP